MDILWIILPAVGGLVIGFFVGRTSKRCDGMFIVDDSDDNTTRWILDMKIDQKAVENRKKLYLKVRKMDEGCV